MTAHSPAPWVAHKETPYRRAEVTRGVREDPIAEVYGASREEREANANVMAAGPEMLEVLRRLVATRPATRAARCDEDFAIAMAASAAIAKAEGRAE